VQQLAKSPELAGVGASEIETAKRGAKNALFWAKSKRSFYQDRLGTNIGKDEKTRRFSQAGGKQSMIRLIAETRDSRRKKNQGDQPTQSKQSRAQALAAKVVAGQSRGAGGAGGAGDDNRFHWKDTWWIPPADSATHEFGYSIAMPSDSRHWEDKPLPSASPLRPLRYRGQENAYFAPRVMLKTITLPRQARGKHRENSKKTRFP
jgi:hypothetical protein